MKLSNDVEKGYWIEVTKIVQAQQWRRYTLWIATIKEYHDLFKLRWVEMYAFFC